MFAYYRVLSLIFGFQDGARFGPKNAGIWCLNLSDSAYECEPVLGTAVMRDWTRTLKGRPRCEGWVRV